MTEFIEFTEFGLVFHPLPGTTGQWEAICPKCGLRTFGERASVCWHTARHICLPPLCRWIRYDHFSDYFSSEPTPLVKSQPRPHTAKSDDASGREHV